jgi:drug/metabolite transporter (DMT)-like permease
VVDWTRETARNAESVGQAAPVAQPLRRAQDSKREPHSTRAGFCLAIAGAVAFSAKAIIVKLAFRHGADYTVLVFYRMLFALPLFLALAWWHGRGKPGLSAAEWRSVCLLGFFGGYLTCVLDFAGLQYVSASLERLIMYLTPTLVLLINVVALKRPFHVRHAGALAASYAGVLLMLGRETLFAGAHAGFGAALVFGSAITYAIYLIHVGEVVSRLGAARLTGLATSVACFLSIAHFAATQPLSALRVAPEVLGLSLLNGLFCTFLPILMVMLAIARIGAPLAAQCGMAGPVATVALGVLVLGEAFTPWEAAGTALVLLGIWMLGPANAAQARCIASPRALGQAKNEAGA